MKTVKQYLCDTNAALLVVVFVTYFFYLYNIYTAEFARWYVIVIIAWFSVNSYLYVKIEKWLENT